MINTDRIVQVAATDLLSLYGLILKVGGQNVAALDATNPAQFEVTSTSGSLLLADEPVETLDIASGVTAVTIYFVPSYDYVGFSINGAAVTPTGDVEPDGRTLYKAVLASNAITITKVGF